jgi:uncharacterized protein YbbC (DUF1343 family)
VSTKVGLDVLLVNQSELLRGKTIGVVCNQASIASDCRHILEHLSQAEAGFSVGAVFGPQHGLWGHTQDNMIEWEGYRDPRFVFPIYSLYGANRTPTDAQLSGLEVLLVDLPDVGSRYYTFIWTMAHCFEACAKLGIPVIVLDRPNPIGGVQVEGTVLLPEFASFVGLHPLPMRHGMTIGEIANHLRQTVFPTLDLTIVHMEGWRRDMHFDDTGLPWAMPSPNMPTPESALVYPGGCLVEGTNLSEGRGTTRPFEILGAPFIDGIKLCECLNGLGLSGAHFRPIQFQPTFNKFAGKLCEGLFLHVTDRNRFEPCLTFAAILQTVVRFWGTDFAWKMPPYEYELKLMPIDILAGNDWLRSAIETDLPLDQIRARFLSEVESFEPRRREALLY